jgi:hypothetical protein
VYATQRTYTDTTNYAELFYEELLSPTEWVRLRTAFEKGFEWDEDSKLFSLEDMYAVERAAEEQILAEEQAAQATAAAAAAAAAANGGVGMLGEDELGEGGNWEDGADLGDLMGDVFSKLDDDALASLVESQDLGMGMEV